MSVLGSLLVSRFTFILGSYGEGVSCMCDGQRGEIG